MKKSMIAASALLLAFISFSCSSPAYVEKSDGANLSAYKTYAWVNTSSSENEESKRATEYADINVHNAADAELLNRWGWKEVTDNPDVLVSYDVFVDRNTEVQQNPVYSQPYTRYYYNRYTRRWSTIYYPAQFVGYDTYETPVKEGTITITMVDARTDKKIWQGWTTERLGASGIRDLDVRRSVKNIFKQGS